MISTELLELICTPEFIAVAGSGIATVSGVILKIYREITKKILAQTIYSAV